MPNIARITVKVGMDARFVGAIEALDRNATIISRIPPRSFTIDTKLTQCELEKMTSVECVNIISGTSKNPITVGDVSDFALYDENYSGDEIMLIADDNGKDSYIIINFDFINNSIKVFPSHAIIINVSDFLTMLKGFEKMALMRVGKGGSTPLVSITRENSCYILK